MGDLPGHANLLTVLSNPETPCQRERRRVERTLSEPKDEERGAGKALLGHGGLLRGDGRSQPRSRSYVEAEGFVSCCEPKGGSVLALLAGNWTLAEANGLEFVLRGTSFGATLR